ncbi:natural cytotoxicity triggering receptor 3 ligand 1-like [Cetorhinus maximus]
MKILTFCCLVSLISTSDSIGLEIFQSPLKVLLNEDVHLKCKATGYVGATIDPKTVGVEWIFEGQTKVYSFFGGEHNSSRPGASISDSALLKGDASLYLPKVQLADEGKYTCNMFITPENAEQTSAMQVSARPNVSLSTQSITILSGSEGSVRCDVTGFYPQQLDFSWVKISKSRTENVPLESYTKHFANNNDKTFNVSSQLMIRPTVKDDGDKYRCVVKHSTFPDGFTVESVLTVTAPRNHSLVISAIICVTGLLCIYTWLWNLRLEKAVKRS